MGGNIILSLCETNRIIISEIKSISAHWRVDHPEVILHSIYSLLKLTFKIYNDLPILCQYVKQKQHRAGNNKT